MSNQDLQFIAFYRTRNSEINSVKEAQRDAEQSVHANGQENMYRTRQENENEMRITREEQNCKAR